MAMPPIRIAPIAKLCVWDVRMKRGKLPSCQLDDRILLRLTLPMYLIYRASEIGFAIVDLCGESV